MMVGNYSKMGIALAFTLACTLSLSIAPAVGFGTKAYGATPNPASDPSNTQGWVFLNDFSDEFDGTSLDTGKWETLPVTWRDKWLWDGNQADVSSGNLNLTMAYEASDKFNQTPKNWTTVQFGDDSSQFADYVTTNQHRSGNSALVHYFYYPYHVETQQTITGLAKGTYTFSAYVWSQGSQTIKRLVATGCGGADLYANIPSNNGGYVQYSIANINVTAGQCTIGIESDAPAYSWLRIDDISFSNNAAPATNLAVNPGFESRNTSYYKSGGIKSLNDIKYGYLETRIDGSMPIPGTCPAFWLWGVDNTWGNEIDIIEFGENTSNINALDMTLHNWKKPGFTGHWSSGGTYSAPFDPSAGYHTYGLDWGPGYQKWYIDGVLRRTTNNSDFDQMAMQIYVSLGLRQPYQNSPTPTGFPGTANFDYVRVWKLASQSVNNTKTGSGEAQFAYHGTWTNTSQSGAYMNDNSYSGHAGDDYEVKFYGTGIQVFSSKAPGQGIAAYSIDGGTETLVDHYAPSRVDNVSVWTSPTLTRGIHTLKVRVTGTRNGSSTGTNINADRVDLLN